jgi:DNA-binding NtrC family response regulator
MERPIAMLRALDPVLNAFAGGRVIWLAGNTSEESRVGTSVTRWHQEGPLVVLRLRPGEDLWGILVAERAHGSEVFGTKDLRILSLFGSLLSASVEARHQAQAEAGEADRPDAAHDPFGSFLTVDPTTRDTVNLLRRVADSDASVLITGETGTGKGLLALCVHRASRRRDRNLIQVNCAALPESLLESELFGHVQGAFTGAVRNKRGLIEEADGGTLFLDEVDRCHRNVQAKLLHVLDSKEFRPVGDVRSKTVDVRIICATNTDLAAAIQSGEFLEDLYYRLNDFQVGIPPLRDRREDIPILVRHFFAVCAKEGDRKPAGISREVLQRLMDHDWRGNVRELSKCIRRLIVLSEDGEWIAPEMLPPEFRDGANRTQVGRTLRDSIRRLESTLIGQTLRETGGNKSETSRRLHLSYPALLSKIKEYGLEPGNPSKNTPIRSKKSQ